MLRESWGVRFVQLPKPDYLAARQTR
jgi:hypothetical protein